MHELLLQVGAEIAVIAAAVIAGLLVLWVVVSVPVWIAAKVLTLGRAKFARAMLVTAVGPAIYAVVLFISAAVLTATFGETSLLVAASFVIAFVAWIAVFKKGFDTGWLRALAIAILAIIVFAVIGVIITLVIQAFVPQAPPITPFPMQQA